MKYYDISMEIHPNMQVYKNNQSKLPIITNVANYSTSSYYESNILFNLHTGTHIDMPLHMIPNGDDSQNFKLDNLILKNCVLLDLTHLDDKICKNDLEQFNIKQDDFILFKTKSSFSNKFIDNFVYLEETAARYLVEKKICGVGIDALGIERSQKDHITHKILFDNNILIIEGLYLKDVPSKSYQMIALPLKINNVEALPMRVILIDSE